MLNAQQAELLDKVLEDLVDEENAELNEHLKALVEEKQAILEQLGAIQQATEQQVGEEARRQEFAEWLKQQPSEFTEYEDAVTRKYVEKITVLDPRFWRPASKSSGSGAFYLSPRQ